MPTRYLGVLVAVLLLAPATLAQHRQSGAADEAATHVRNNAFRYGLEASDLADLVVTRAYESRRSGTTHVHLQQHVHGLPVVGGEFNVAVGRDGRVFHAAGHGASLADPARLSTSPALTAEAAASALARDAGLAPAAPFAVVSRAAVPGTRSERLTLTDGGVAGEPLAARLVYRLDERGALALAWEVGLYEANQQHYWLGYVDAGTGRVLARHDLVVHDHFGEPEAQAVAETAEAARLEEAHLALRAPEAPGLAPTALVGSYKVYPMPIESPNHTTPLPPADARVVVNNPDDAQASPFGWHDTNGAAGAEFTTHRGNNVHAYLDRNGDGAPDAGEPDGGGGLVFNFPLDLNQQPSGYSAAAVTNLFYWNNVFHDVMWHHGFDEASGNFQVNNYGNGGLGNDDVRAEAQDGGGLNNANFFTPEDGQRPRMQMYEWTQTNPRRDGDLDAGIILHEYGHGVSRRLIGVNCMNNAEQMGEGWSDYFGALFTIRPGDTRSTRRGIATYSIGQPITGGGLRTPPWQPVGAPYAADFAINNFTYQHSRTQIVPHGVGFIWASALWEVTWDMIDAHGYDPDLYDVDGHAGNQIMLALVTEGLKQTACNPGFISGRDAILAADQALYNGAHTGTLWTAFARRGLGAAASQGSTFTNSDNTESFALPNVTLTVAPSNPPVIVDRGDAFSLTAELVVGAGAPSSLQYWVEATYPNGNVNVVLGPNTINVSQGTYSRTLTQQVPNGAPLGDYLYTMKVGTFPNNDLSSDGFGLTVTAPAGVAAREAEAAAGPWATYGDDGAPIEPGTTDAFALVAEAAEPTAEAVTASSAGLPAEPTLHAAYPNPFDATTTLRYDVAATGTVRVAVYDLLGREVAVLADGAHEAGSYAVALDGRTLPAGVYLVRMTADRFTQTRRVTVLQ
jgi:extracellular elastinolytic metalloproteinase